MTTGEVASMFRVTEATVTAWVREGKLAALTTPGGKGYRFHRETVEAFLAPTDPADAA